MIHYLRGDATRPRNLPSCIVHVTNDKGGWGKGFVMALERRFPGLGAKWRAKAQKLGEVSIMQVAPMTAVAHCCAQAGYKSAQNPIPLQYDALARCLRGVALVCRREHWSVCMPRIGCGLAGGDWAAVEAIINEELKDVDVYVYDLEKKP